MGNVFIEKVDVFMSQKFYKRKNELKKDFDYFVVDFTTLVKNAIGHFLMENTKG